MLSSLINDIFVEDDTQYVLCIVKHHLVLQNESSLHGASKYASYGWKMDVIIFTYE